MSEQYFTSQPTSAQDMRSIKVEYGEKTFHFQTDAGVFSRDELDPGSRLLLDACLPRLKGRVLDLGCGWGPVGTIVSRLCTGCQVEMTDINQRATDLARLNLLKNKAQAQVFTGNGFGPLTGQYDWILINPPIRAGKQLVYQLFFDSSRHLRPDGCLAVVIRKQQGAQSAKDYLETLFPQVKLAARKKGYHVYFCEVTTR